MEENQNIDYKRIWKDEYLQWICGFANAQGGRLLRSKKNLKKLILTCQNLRSAKEDLWSR